MEHVHIGSPAVTFARRTASGPFFRLLADTIGRLTRAELEALTESIIDRLDALDGDPDLEDDDPAGGNSEDVGELELSRGVPHPIYGADQRRLPRNAQFVWEHYWYDERTGRAHRHGEAMV